ncbi:MAG: glycosyltransferase family 2 protein [Thermodesulfobacteriota bacterium]
MQQKGGSTLPGPEGGRTGRPRSPWTPAYDVLRNIYWRFAAFPAAHVALLRWWGRARQGLLAFSHSPDNRRFRRDMAARRSDEAAVRTAVPAPEPDEWPELDLSVVTHDSSRWLDGFFASLTAQRYPLDRLYLRIVDNGSSDDTAGRIRDFLAEKREGFAGTWFVAQENAGFGAGHDRALRAGRCAYCLVANVDLEFLPDSLCAVVRAALADTGGIVGSWELRQYPYEHPKHYDPVTLETAWSSHACVLLRRSAYERCGGYDPALFMYAEDVELSYRLRSHGYALKYVPAAAVTHHAYEAPGAAKPAQYAGGAFGNLFVRLRYGNIRDVLAGLALYAAFLIRPEPFPGVKRSLLRKLAALVPALPRLRRAKGPARARYPFRGLDYELSRGGAFVPARPPAFPPGEAPRVSVLIRTYAGRGFLLAQAVQSVFNQTWPAVELVVSEDGGDTQKELVETLARRAPAGTTVRHIPNPRRGRSATGNAALKAASAPYFLFLDDDDLLYADHIETLMRALSDHPECHAAYAPGLEVVTRLDPARGRYVEACERRPKGLWRTWDYAALREDNYIVISALASRSLYEERGGFDPEVEMLEDWNLWMRYGFGNAFAYVPKITMLYRTPFDPWAVAGRGRALHEAHPAAKARAMAAIRAGKDAWSGSRKPGPAT